MGSETLRRSLATMLIGTMIALVPASALAASGRVTLEVPNASGTQFGFDVETAGATPATAASTDVRTHTSTTVGYRQLVALNGGGVAKLATTDFAAVGCVEMRGAALNGTVFTGSDGSTDPVPGTIYVVRSNLGNYAKMQLVSIKTTAPKGLVLDFETSDCPLDSTPPVITPSVTGAEGFAGWYVGPVTISWTVTDEQSGISSTEGCDTAELSDDSRETTITCTATSAGGTASQSVTVSIDRTAPVVAYDGNRGTYELDEHVVVDCVASDDTSGIASDTCASVDAPAHELGPGTHTASASATDVAGNEGEGSAEFEVIVTPGGVARLIVKLITDTGLASTLRYKAAKVADAANANARDGALRSFENYVRAKIGRGMDEVTAHLLLSLVSRL